MIEKIFEANLPECISVEETECGYCGCSIFNSIHAINLHIISCTNNPHSSSFYNFYKDKGKGIGCKEKHLAKL